MGRIASKVKQLQFAVYCFYKGQDARFVKNVKMLDEVKNLVYIEAYGEIKRNENVFFIDMEESHSGFFADHNRLLAMLYFADKYDLVPVVRYPDGYCYAEDHPVNGTSNPFEYYFEQPGGISLEEVKNCRTVLRSRKENCYLANELNKESNGYARSELYLNEMARITAKYIRLKSNLKCELAQEIEQLLGQNLVLAVHVRGTDFKNNYNGHPIKVKNEEYLQETIKIFEAGNYNKVFLATDDLNALEQFKSYFGEQLLFYKDVIRSSGNDTVMHSVEDRQNHHYRLGVEVLRDMFTLAACNGLVAGLSQVSYAARIQKKSVGEDYRNLMIIDKGINYHRKNNCPTK